MGILGRKNIIALADKNQQARLERIFEGTLQLWGSEKLKLFEAMEMVVNLQMHLNRQLNKMHQQQTSPPEMAKGEIPNAAG